MPSGGDGFYYFSVYFQVYYYESATFDVQINGNNLCTAQTDQGDRELNYGQSGCSAATYVVECLLH